MEQSIHLRVGCLPVVECIPVAEVDDGVCDGCVTCACTGDAVMVGNTVLTDGSGLLIKEHVVAPDGGVRRRYTYTLPAFVMILSSDWSSLKRNNALFP